MGVNMSVDFSQNLVKPLEYLFTFSLGMGDSFTELVSWYAERAGIPYDEYLDEDEEGYQDPDEVFRDALEVLVGMHEERIIDELLILTDGDMLDWVLDELEDDPKMLKALRAVYRYIGNWKGGDKVRQAIETNIFPHIED